MSENTKKEVQVTFNLKIIKRIIISFCISLILLFALQHFGDVYEDQPRELNVIYPCEKMQNGSYEILFGLDRERNSGINQTRCAYSSTKLLFKNPISKKEYSSEAFSYLVIFPPNSSTGHTNDDSEYKNYKDNLEKYRSYEGKLTHFYIPSLKDHPLHILILTILIYFLIWIFTKFKFNLNLKKD